MTFEFPISRHRFTTEEFNQKKADYVAKYGYTMYIPGFSDIFKLNIPKPPTEEETKLYLKKDVKALGAFRYEQIKEYKAEKKEAFLRMMGSPTPTWINNIGTSMTFLDDINDTAGTLSVVARTAAHLLPKAVGKFFMGPAGWALTVADAVNVAMTIARAPLDRLTRKGHLDAGYDMNPFSKEAKVRRAKRLRRIKPSKGEFIELFQTTNNMFGVGLSLGCLVGAFIEAFTGPYRVLTGKKVTVKWPIPKISSVESSAMTGMLAAFNLNNAGSLVSDEDILKTNLVAEMATHVLHPLFQEYHILARIDGLEHIIPTPPKVKDPITKLILEEEGIDPEKAVGFPHAEETDGSAGSLMDVAPSRRFTNLHGYARNNRNTPQGVLGMQAANNFAENSLALFEGADQVETQHHPALKAAFLIIHNGYFFGEKVKWTEIECFIRRIKSLSLDDIHPTFEDLRDYICPGCGINLELCEGLRRHLDLKRALGPVDWETYLATGHI